MSHRLPPLSALRAFEAAARLGRMTAAAEELSVTPGAISRQVRQLEQHLGVALFDGSKARPTLTPAAHVLQPVLTTAFAHIADAVREVSDSRRGPLDVACFSTFTVKWLIPRLFDFQAQHPGIEVRLRTTDAGTGECRMHGDLTITAEEATGAWDTSKEQRLFPEHLGPVLSPELAQRVALRQSADLADPALAPVPPPPPPPPRRPAAPRGARAGGGGGDGVGPPRPPPPPGPGGLPPGGVCGPT